MIVLTIIALGFMFPKFQVWCATAALVCIIHNVNTRWRHHGQR